MAGSTDLSAEACRRVEAEWAAKAFADRRSLGDLDQNFRNRVVMLVLGVSGWRELAELTDLSESTIRRKILKRSKQQKILDQVNKRRPQSNISVNAFLAWTTDDPKPVTAFHRWLGETRSPPHIYCGLLNSPNPNTPPEPNERMTGIVEFLKRADLRSVKVVHQAGMTEGLRALASHLIFRAIPADPDLKWHNVCYLPVTRDPVSHERITFPRLVRDIHAFYCREPKAEQLEVPPDTESLRSALTQIRAAMMTKPAILILDGHSVLRGALPELRALVSDDALTALLREIIHPFIGHTVARQTFRFYENRFLILADYDLTDMKPFSDESLLLPHLPVERMSSVFASQGRENVEQLLAIYQDDRMKPDAAMALSDTVISLRKIELGPSGNASCITKGLTAPDQAYNELVIELKKQKSLIALFALRLIAITDGGLRETTLVRLVDQWRKLAPSAWGEEFMLPELHLADVRVILNNLRAILVQGDDQKIAGLDDMNEPYVYLDEEAQDNTLDNNDRVRSFDLRSSDLRKSIIKQLVDTANGTKAVSLMHRLFAEEGLRQQTHAMRHAEWRGSADARYYRRLLQFLFHGFASLSLGPEYAAPMADAAPTVLPSKPSSAYRRLYSVFFRTLLEHPPHFDLSRSLGRDRLKAELLLLAMNADVPMRDLWQNLHGERSSLAPRHSHYLPTNGPAHEAATNLRIAVEQCLSLARAAYEADALDDALLAHSEAEHLRTGFEADFGPTEGDGRLPAQKILLDIQIQKSPLGQVGSVESALRDAEFGQPMLEALRGLQSSTDTATTPVQAEKLLYDATQTFVGQHCRGLSAHRLAIWSDMLCRLGEVQAIEAYNFELGGRTLARYRAFIVFYLAERIRREAFDQEPLGRTYVPNSHSTRVFVRIALQLVRTPSRNRTSSAPFEPNYMPSRRYFIMLARRHLDLLTRYSARYPSERPSILVLEATFTRSVGGLSLSKLLSALKLIEEADKISFTVPDRPRVRRRLILERIKVLSALATAAQFDDEGKSADGSSVWWWKLAVLDVIRLWRLTVRERLVKKPVSLWERAISDQAETLRVFARQMDYSPHQVGLHPSDWESLLEIPQINSQPI